MLKPTLVSVVALDGRDENELLALATGAAGGHTVVVGDAAQFAALGLSVERLGDWPERLRQHGQRVVFVAIDGRTAGLLGVIDTQGGGDPSTARHRALRCQDRRLRT